VVVTWKRILAVFLHTAEFMVKAVVNFQTVLISSHCSFYTSVINTTVIYILFCSIYMV
jgi:hypothetical protein